MIVSHFTREEAIEEDEHRGGEEAPVLGRARAAAVVYRRPCRRHGLSIKSFGYRKRTIRKDTLALVEVPLGAPVYTVSKPLSLAVGHPYTILIEPGFDAETLRRLLEVLDR